MPFGPFAELNLSLGVDTSSKGERHCEAFATGASVSTGAFAVMLPSTTATTSPTLAVAPGPTRISYRRPPPTACTSTVTLSVSTSKRLSPSRISSPIDLNQARTFPSATVSPSCGMMIVEVIGLSVQNTTHIVDDACGAWQRQIFEMIGCGKRNMRRGDAYNGPVEIPEGLVRHYGGDFRAPSAESRVFFHGEQAARLGDGA